ncbi:MAG: hypothetical protein NW208_00045 [Bryobacter sp.]|nr:hypothetical protein [Bryobacter sp.]
MVWAINLGIALLCLFSFVNNQQILLRSDGGIFAHIGQQLALGRQLYVDLWDHKPPLIYWWNALGCHLDPQGLRGIWFLTSAHFFAAGNLLYFALRPRVGSLPAGIACVLFAAGIFHQLDQPNYTETFALPWQITLLWLAFIAMERAHSLPSTFFAGICTAMLLATRPNNAGAGAFFLASLTISGLLSKKDQKLSIHYALWLAGLCVALLLISIPFILSGAFEDLLFASFQFNFIYASQKSLSQQVGAALQGLLQLHAGGALLFAFVGWLLLVSFNRTLALLLGCWFCLEIFLASLSGRAYEHYFVVPLAAAVSLAAFGLRQIFEELEFGTPLYKSIFVSLLLLFGLQALWAIRANRQKGLDSESPGFKSMVSFLGPKDSYYCWGNGPRHIWFNLRRPPPVPLFHTTPLLANEGQYRILAPALFRSLLANPPVRLIEYKDTVVSLSPDVWDSQETAQLKRQFLALYLVAEQTHNHRFWVKRTG